MNAKTFVLLVMTALTIMSVRESVRGKAESRTEGNSTSASSASSAANGPAKKASTVTKTIDLADIREKMNQDEVHLGQCWHDDDND